ncbi:MULTISPECIES: hypothetical protein [Pseudomonadati]|uniref:Uncharacterized protein n=2 Tax=Pseudomonadati TaxID=3379134 RepID=A0A562RNZ2_9BACT|nr:MULTISPECIES: hypothetical protein [Bacteria]MBC5853460.1 hypothetical protein [Vibrio metschnikovii]TWI70779.1 hypothetical protein LZ24_02200 [Desulfobotulus alkaliphilus]
MSGEYVCDISHKVWVSAIQYAVENIDQFSFDAYSMHMLWIVNGGHIRRHISDDKLILKWLKLILPKYEGGELQLYRGECQFLYDQGLIGFCWTPKKQVAEKFARGLNAIESGGVLLSAYVSSEAILSAPNSHSADWLEESEYTCDPTQIRSIEVLHKYPKLD